jgi:penicillin amidase
MTETSRQWRSALAATALALLVAPAVAAERVETRRVAGLVQPAEIRVDRWGIAHLYATSERDAFFLQGYNAARDRLWQIDLWRKRGLGLLSGSFGPAYVPQDRAARLFLYRGDMASEWAAYGAAARDRTMAFVAGINAFIAEVRAGQQPLPPEFGITGTQPDDWQIEDVVRIRSHGLTRNLASEVTRAQVACRAGVETDRLRQSLKPDWTTRIPDGLDPCDVPTAVLDDYRLGTAGVRFEGFRPVLADADPTAEAIGSNNWVIGPSRTATGRPILANDPHRELGIPSLRYVVHMEAPGLSAIGAGEPALPGISIGHNGTIAFGLTIFSIDQEDLYVYDLDPANPDRYRYQGRWEPMTVVREKVAVKGGGERDVELRFTRHGPVLHIDRTKAKAYAMRSVWGGPGTSAYFGSMHYMTAKDWKEFVAAMDGWGAPSENQVYADTAGHIGWLAAGRAPVRRNWDGLLPVPGDGRYEWQGFLATDALPRAFDPPAGWIATANEMNLPPDYPVAERKVGFEWPNDARHTRIAEVLAQTPKATLADSMALQNDPTNVAARRLVPLLASLATDPSLGADVRLLQGWDGRTTTGSAAAALFEIWLVKHLGRTTVAHAAPEAVRPLIGSGALDSTIALLEAPDGRLGPSPLETRDRILRESLAAAVAEAAAALGPDRRGWAWGKLHHARFEHPLETVAGAAAGLSTPRLPLAGTYLSPLAAGWRGDDYRTGAGASFRMVLDVGNWDASRVVNAPGQSGDPASPHHQDHYALWAQGEYVPLLYSRASIEAATVQLFRLLPD